MTLVAVALVCGGALVTAFIADLDDGTSRAGTGTAAAAAGAAVTPTVAPTTSPGLTVPSITVAARDPRLGSGETVTIAFAGDMHFEGSLRTRLRSDPSTAVGPFATRLRQADLAVGNLETSIAVGGTPEAKRYTFRAPPSAVSALRAAGLDAVTMANNHALDYGPAGLAETLAVKRAQADGFIFGVGDDDAEAFAPFRAVVRGQRIAVIGATQVLDADLIDRWTATATRGGVASAKRVDRLVQEVRAVRADSDTVVVFVHWGIEQQTCPTGDQERLARRLVDAGADIVVGSHTHRLEGGGRLGDAVVHYGLGNFLFGAQSPEAARTGVFEVRITGRRVDGYDWIPGQISGSVPRPLSGQAATAAEAAWQAQRSCTDLTE